MTTPNPEIHDPSKTFFSIPGYSESVRLDTITRIWTSEQLFGRGTLHIERSGGTTLAFKYPEIADATLFASSLRKELEKCGTIFAR